MCWTFCCVLKVGALSLYIWDLRIKALILRVDRWGFRLLLGLWPDRLCFASRGFKRHWNQSGFLVGVTAQDPLHQLSPESALVGAGAVGWGRLHLLEVVGSIPGLGVYRRQPIHSSSSH